ncbi:MAG: TlpA family protein disulfide reductase [Gammaproteobacteria bacterium]|nr:TlpA family protein disulfide reductase [Gammaproteobacteria bacterium]
MRDLSLFIACLMLLMPVPAVYADKSQPLHSVTGTPIAPDFSLQDTEGKRHALQDYRGKVVIVNFWATWCPPCRYELPSMERAYQRLKDAGVEMLAINVGEDADTIFTFTADYPVTFPLLMDRDSKVINDYPVMGLPTTYVIDNKGRLVYRAIGTREWDDAALVQKILDLKK